MTVTDLLDHYRISYREAGSHHHVSQGWVGVDCPSCSPGSGRFRLGFNLERKYLSCWQCGYLPLISTFAEITGESYTKIALTLGGTRYEPDPTLHRGVGRLQVPDRVGPLLTAHKDYLHSRGLDPDAMENRWGFRGIGIGGHLSWRVWIPVHLGGRCVSWTTRSIGDKNHRRYVSARYDEEEISIKRLLFGEDHARHAVVVVEGPLDAVRVGPGAVATFGTEFTRAQVAKIGRYATRAVVFDSEPDAQRRARELCSQLTVFPGVTHCVTLDAKDPGSASEAEIDRLRNAYLM